jgi:hypothetical protein
LACAFFAEDVVRVLLGPKWSAAAPIFRYLAPTILAFAVLNPLGWLLNALGLVWRGLKIAFVLGPVMVAGYAFGIHYGPTGVAIAYSTTMMLCVLPLIAWAVHGTAITLGDVLHTVGQPLISSIVGALFAFGVHIAVRNVLSPLPMLVLESTVLLLVFLGILFYVMGQKTFYMNLLQGFKRRTPIESEVLAST